MSAPVGGLTDAEKAAFNTVIAKGKASPDPREGLVLLRMLLDGREVAVVGCTVFNRFSGRAEGTLPLAVLLDDDTTLRLRAVDGSAAASVSPHDLDPNR